MRLIVIGGGAAGFFCAVNAARMDPSLEVCILEKSSKLLSKVRVSGGGRCNVTHACFSIPEMIQKYPRGTHFLKKAFHQFFTTDTIRWFEERGVALKTEADGRLFPVTDDSQTIIECLLREAHRYKVTIKLNAGVQALRPEDGRFGLQLANGGLLTADFVCVACGGYPKPALFDWLRPTGHSIELPLPSLFTFNMPGNPITRLMGVSVPDVQVKVTGTRLTERGPLLITHWGLSGPVILRLSAWGARLLAEKQYTAALLVNWLPDLHEQSAKEQLQAARFDLAARQLHHKNPFGLPQRLWQYLLEQSGIQPGLLWADLPVKEQNRLAANLCRQELPIRGKTTFREEFVTAGGIRLSEVDAHTMQSKQVPHLFFAGEILDVDGITGGFNFQHAWTSGFIAAQSIAYFASALSAKNRR